MNILDQQYDRIHQLQSNLVSLRGKLDLQEEHRVMANGHRERMGNKLREGDAREAVLRDEQSELKTVCSELKESAKQLLYY